MLQWGGNNLGVVRGRALKTPLLEGILCAGQKTLVLKEGNVQVPRGGIALPERPQQALQRGLKP